MAVLAAGAGRQLRAGRPSRLRSDRVLVFDSDSGNPYGACLASELAAHMPAALAAGSDVRLPDREIPLRALRPTRSGGVRLRTGPGIRDAAREAVTVAGTVAHQLRGGPTVVVWARTYQKALLGTASRLRPSAPLFVIDHNPVPTRESTGLRRRIDERLLAGARILVHSPEYLDRGGRPAGRGVDAVPHISYRRYLADLGFDSGARPTGPTTLLLLGALRRDKILPDRVSWLAEALGARGAPGRLLLATRPRLELAGRAGSLEVVNRSADAYLSDEAVVAALEDADVLLAPYADTTESGTVRLARAAGLQVLAFDSPVLRGYLPPHCLVPAGNWDAYLGAARALLDDGARRGIPDEHGTDAETRQWLTVLASQRSPS